jgi:hypothetical protein
MSGVERFGVAFCVHDDGLYGNVEAVRIKGGSRTAPTALWTAGTGFGLWHAEGPRLRHSRSKHVIPAKAGIHGDSRGPRAMVGFRAASGIHSDSVLFAAENATRCVTRLISFSSAALDALQQEFVDSGGDLGVGS